ncbi:MAG: ubiquinol oxidase [Patescibacteria group bacterium]|jgi:hypothetical protein|nr:ubiquinol oxidase [Patescibacteria group bacterium]
MVFSLQNQETEAVKLCNADFRQATFDAYKDFRAATAPKILARALFMATDLVYGKAPSYNKFYAIEIIARIPYQSWEMWSYIVQTLYFSQEQKTIELGELAHFSRVAQDNETMHVVVIGTILQKQHSLIRLAFPFILSFIYFQACFLLHLLSRTWAYELNFLFEEHAYRTYDAFLQRESEQLKQAPLDSAYLKWYGRDVKNQYEFVELVRNDELLHRNASVTHMKR